MKLKLFTSAGADSQEKDFPAIREFEGDKGLLALKQYLVAYQANQRQGNACTRLRSEVSGTGKKPFRQKGTGMARQGSYRSPQHRTGGVAHGPRLRDYYQKVNKKTRRLAFQRALFDRAVDQEIHVIERFECAEAKTRVFKDLIDKMVPEGNILVVDEKWAPDTLRAARNLDRVAVSEAYDLNAYDLCRYDYIIVSEQGMVNILDRTTDQKASS